MLLQTNMVNTIYERIADAFNSKAHLQHSMAPSVEYSPKKQSSSAACTIPVKTIDWTQLYDVEYFTKGGSSIIYTAFYDGKEVIVKIVDPEYENDEAYENEMENELNILSTLNHEHILKVYGAGYKKGKIFLVLERLMSSLSDVVESKPCNQKSKIWRQLASVYPLKDGIKYARAIADAVQYCHDLAVPGCMLLHRDLKPGNIGKLTIPNHIYFLYLSFLH